EKGLLERGQFEEVALFGYAIQRPLVYWTQRRLLFWINFFELVAVSAEPAVVAALVDVAALVHQPPEVLHRGFVMRIGSPQPQVVLDTQRFKRLFEIADDCIDVLLDRDTQRFRGPLDVYAVFVSPGQKEGVKPSLPFEADQRVGDKSRVRVADVRLRVGVVDRCRYVECLLSHFVS